MNKNNEITAQNCKQKSGRVNRGVTEFRNEIVASYPNNKIIFLPQSITYLNSNHITIDAQICAQHNDLHICARDNESFTFLQKHFYKNHIYLLPDTAWGLYESFPKCSNFSNHTLVLLRKDKEFSSEIYNTHKKLESVEIKDWDDILYDIKFFRLVLVLRIIKKMWKLTSLSVFLKFKDLYQFSTIEPFLYYYIPREFLKYGKIFSTRLHGVILAKLLNIPVEFSDTKYGKINNYMNTWFSK